MAQQPEQTNLLDLTPDPSLAKTPLFPKTEPEPFQRPEQPNPHTLARQVAASAPPDVERLSPRVALVRSQQSTFTVIGFSDEATANEFMAYLFKPKPESQRRLSAGHRLSSPQYLDYPVEVHVWGLNDGVLKQLVERDGGNL